MLTRKSILILSFISMLLTFVACNKNETTDTIDRYEWMQGKVSAKVTNSFQGKSAAKSLDTTYSATCVAFLSPDLVAVSYHGYQQEFYGKVNIFRYNTLGETELLSTLDLGGRINALTTDGNNRLFFGLDTKNGPVVAATYIANGRFPDDLTSIPTLAVNGKSINCVAYVVDSGVELLYSATGGNSSVVSSGFDTTSTYSNILFNGNPIPRADFYKQSGFQRCVLTGTTLSPNYYIRNNNMRGKWVDCYNGTMVTHYLSLTGDQWAHSQIRYYDHITPDFDRVTVAGYKLRNTDLESKNMVKLRKGADNQDYVFVCGADQGLYSYKISKIEGRISENPVSHLDLSAYALNFDDNGVLYVAGGQKGVYRLGQVNGVMSLDKRYIHETSGILPSANFVAKKDNLIFIAYGKKGLEIVTDDAF